VSGEPSALALELPEPAYWVLWLLFGVSSIGTLQLYVPSELPLLDRALMTFGLSLVITSMGWFFLLALRCSVLWSIAMLIPYINLIAISMFARRYWTRGARLPALLVLGATLAQLALMLRWLFLPPSGPALF